ncbi:CRM-domain containing factor CFM3, chloroplastic/mitochondrial-like [Typha latifolia]|uniref:CRM-domain containing factor CFM3, chloroplastic/mitochondrial-like n=1 Tax=Typha latifolia TaxID=4733 RepID=UPI003C2DC86F
MAISSSLPWNPPPPLSPSPSFYRLVSLDPRKSRSLTSRYNSRRLEAYLPSSTLQSPNEDYPQTQSRPTTSEIEKAVKKKKKKLRPSFYDQTLERWSVKNPSQRSRFPWQEKESGENEDDEEDFSPTGTSTEPMLGNEVVASGIKFRDAQGPEEHNKSRLGLIVEKLNEYADNDNTDHHGNTEAVGKSLGFPLPSRLACAPWVHGAKFRETHLDSEDEFERKDEELGAGVMNEEATVSFEQNDSQWMLDGYVANSEDKDTHFSVGTTPVSSLTVRQKPPITKPLVVPSGDEVINPIKHHQDPVATSQKRLLGQDSDAGSQSGVSVIVEKLRNSMDEDFSKLVNGHSSDPAQDIEKLMGSVSFPWEQESGSHDGDWLYRKSNTELAERTIPELELRRLRDAALRMKERMKVGPAGVTEEIVESIHKKWKEEEVVKLRFEGPPTLNMKKTHEILESKTGGLVIWRSGRSLVLYRGMNYELRCVQSYSKLTSFSSNHQSVLPTNGYTEIDVGSEMKESSKVSKVSDANSATSFLNPSEEHMDTSEIDSLLDQLGPRFKDWSGRSPLPVDADLLPGVVSGYKPPFRLLPYKTKTALRNKEMTYLRRLARGMPPHFALGRNRQHEGLATAIVKLWEKSAIAKIAIKRGVQNTCNDRMAEEIKKLTGGILLSRNKEYIVLYRGNDFLTPSIREVLIEKEQLAVVKQDEEEAARLKASASIVSNSKASKGPLVAGTLAETVEAKTRWGNPLSSKDREKMKKDLAVAKHTSLVRYLERKLYFVKAKVAKAEKALAKVQEFLTPAELPTDLETVTDEERFLFRKMGLKMNSFLFLGRRGVFDGTVQNMHLHWKHRELVKVLVKGKSFPQVKQIAISLEAESGGVLISLDKTTKGYAIVIYRGKNYQRPQILRPKNLLTRRQALARSIELQRREALNYHISNLRERIQMLKSQLDQMNHDKEMEDKDLILQVNDALLSDDNIEDEGEEAYLEIYGSGNEE